MTTPPVIPAIWSSIRMRSRPRRRPSLVKGAIAGAAGGLAAAAAEEARVRMWDAAGDFVHARGDERGDRALAAATQSGPVGEARGLEPVDIGQAEFRLEAAARRTLGLRDPWPRVVAHFGLAAAVGAAYGAVVEYWPRVSWAKGAPMGAALWSVTDQGPLGESGDDAGKGLVTNVAFGVVAERTRRAVRAAL